MKRLKRYIVVGKMNNREYESALLTLHVKPLNQAESLQHGTLVQYFPTMFGFVRTPGERAEQRETYSAHAGQPKITLYEKELGGTDQEHFLILTKHQGIWGYRMGFVVSRQCSLLLEGREYSNGVVTYGQEALELLADHRGKFY